MPKGVEHCQKPTGRKPKSNMPKSQMPKGVEHGPELGDTDAGRYMPKSQMPKGVEHREQQKDFPMQTRCRNLRCRKALSTEPDSWA